MTDGVVVQLSASSVTNATKLGIVMRQLLSKAALRLAGLVKVGAMASLAVRVTILSVVLPLPSLAVIVTVVMPLCAKFTLVFAVGTCDKVGVVQLSFSAVT